MTLYTHHRSVYWIIVMARCEGDEKEEKSHSYIVVVLMKNNYVYSTKNNLFSQMKCSCNPWHLYGMSC